MQDMLGIEKDCAEKPTYPDRVNSRATVPEVAVSSEELEPFSPLEELAPLAPPPEDIAPFFSPEDLVESRGIPGSRGDESRSSVGVWSIRLRPPASRNTGLVSSPMGWGRLSGWGSAPRGWGEWVAGWGSSGGGRDRQASTTLSTTAGFLGPLIVYWVLARTASTSALMVSSQPRISASKASASDKILSCSSVNSLNVLRLWDMVCMPSHMRRLVSQDPGGMLSPDMYSLNSSSGRLRLCALRFSMKDIAQHKFVK